MLSKYNIYYKQNTYIWIYNNFTKKIIKVSTEEYEIIEKPVLEIINPNLFQKIKKLGILYERNEKEEDYLLKRHIEIIERPSLETTIMASTECNFNCMYCYEDYIPKSINANFEKIFVKYIEKSINSMSGIFINWFGGEPLLVKDRIISISKRIKQVCLNNRKPFLSSMTTNGYFLDINTFTQLCDANVIYYQITIDGDKEWHDRYRPLKSGEGSYDKIIGNLLDIKNNMPKQKRFKITIRNNVSNENFLSCKKNLIYLNNNLFDDDRFELFQFPIKNWGGEKIKALEAHFLSEDMLSSISNEYRRNDILESIEGSMCEAGKKFGFVIDPEMFIYKCNHHIQNSSKTILKNKIGQLFSDGTISINEELNQKWIKPKISSECKSCDMLPSCFATCPIINVKSKPGCRDNKKKEIISKLQMFTEKSKR